MKLRKFFFTISLFLFSYFLITFDQAVKSNYVIDGNKVYINDSNVLIIAEPHTIYSSGWVYFNITPKTYSGKVDVVWGFDTEITKPIKS